MWRTKLYCPSVRETRKTITIFDIRQDAGRGEIDSGPLVWYYNIIVKTYAMEFTRVKRRATWITARRGIHRGHYDGIIKNILLWCIYCMIWPVFRGTMKQRIITRPRRLIFTTRRVVGANKLKFEYTYFYYVTSCDCSRASIIRTANRDRNPFAYRRTIDLCG